MPILSDERRLDWYEKQHTLHRTLELFYVVDGYQLEVLTNDGGTVEGSYFGATMRDAIDAAMRAESAAGSSHE